MDIKEDLTIVEIRIKSLRQQFNYTQNEIAKELGMSQANVSKLIKLTRHRVILHLRRNGYVF